LELLCWSEELRTLGALHLWGTTRAWLSSDGFANDAKRHTPDENSDNDPKEFPLAGAFDLIVEKTASFLIYSKHPSEFNVSSDGRYGTTVAELHYRRAIAAGFEMANDLAICGGRPCPRCRTCRQTCVCVDAARRGIVSAVHSRGPDCLRARWLGTGAARHSAGAGIRPVFRFRRTSTRHNRRRQCARVYAGRPCCVLARRNPVALPTPRPHEHPGRRGAYGASGVDSQQHSRCHGGDQRPRSDPIV